MVLVNLVFLRILAITLIVNSHLGGLYPIAGLSTGGRLGNSLFYFLSGVGLSLSFQRDPVPASEWFKKRFIKLLVPLLIYFGIVSIGNLQGFIDAVMNNLIWHKQDQLERFLPVLLGLYFLFPPIYKLSAVKIRVLLIVLAVISGALLTYRINTVENISLSMPSEGMFFTLNALICFVLGICLNKEKKFELLINSRKNLYATFAFTSIILSQGFHFYIKSIGGEYIALDFYINFITVISLYIFLSLLDFSRFKAHIGFYYGVAASSLAVFVIHFKVITIIRHTDIAFPYNVIGVYLISFISSFYLSRLAANLSNYVMDRMILRKGV